MQSKILLPALLCAALALPANAQDVTLNVHHFLPVTDSVPAEIVVWGETLEEQSGGRIKVVHYPSMQLGGAPASLFDQARDGVVDLVWTVLGYTPGRFPKSEVFEMPFMVTTGEATSRAFQRFVEENAMDEFNGVKLVAVHTHGPGLFHSRVPIENLEDIDRMKIRGGSRVISAMLADLGAEPIGMPVPEVPQNLSRNVITAATIPWQVTLSLRTSEIVRNHTEFAGDHGLYTQTFAFVMNPQSYDRMPEDLQAIVDANSGLDWAARFGAAMDADDVVARDLALSLGNSIVILDEAETDRWRSAAQVTIDKWIAESTRFDAAALYARAVELVEEETAR